MAQLEIRNVTRRFGDFVAVDNVSLNIEVAYPHELSGGQKQRVALARGLVSFASGLLC